jgi:hypothetical protein
MLSFVNAECCLCGAMVFGRVHVGHVKISHLQFGRTLSKMSVSHLSVWLHVIQALV